MGNNDMDQDEQIQSCTIDDIEYTIRRAIRDELDKDKLRKEDEGECSAFCGCMIGFILATIAFFITGT